MRMTICILILCVGCTSHNEQSDATGPVQDNTYPQLLHEIWNAQGGIDTWKDYEAITFTLSSAEPHEVHKVNLGDRKVLIESDSFNLGMDGSGVWVSPSLEAMDGNPRFYHNLMFYFLGIPFVLADPGVNYADAGTMNLADTGYRALRVTFDDGIGDAPDDEYILLADPETKRLEWLLYTVTYFVNEKVTNYNALHYGGWVRAGGLEMPGRLTGYRYENEALGEKRYDMEFRNIAFSREAFPASVFRKPENAEYAPD